MKDVPMHKKWQIVLIGAIVLLAATVLLVVLLFTKGLLFAGYEKAHSLHSPIFSHDGNTVYYLSRRAEGLTYGPGVESFTPPAKVITFSDTLTLQSADVATGMITSHVSWKIPHGKTLEEHYRGRIFGSPSSSLVWGEDGRLVYLFGLDLFPDPVPNLRQTEWLAGSWDPRSGISRVEKNWQKADLSPAPWPDEVLHGDHEVISFQSEAILLHNSKTEELTVVVASDTAENLDEFIKAIRIDEHSHRAELEKQRHMRTTRQNLIATFESEGLSEAEVLLKTSDELERLGHYPKSPKIKAARLDSPGSDYATFHISSDEFRFGLFQDIEKAIKHEPQEIGFWGNYVRHDSFDTSEKLNTYLAAGNTSFYVETGGRYYLMTVIR